jgi:hypothetical protein
MKEMLRHAEKVVELGIERRPSWQYFISREGDVRAVEISADGRISAADQGELIHKLGLEREDGWLYILDAQGDISRVPTDLEGSASLPDELDVSELELQSPPRAAYCKEHARMFIRVSVAESGIALDGTSATLDDFEEILAELSAGTPDKRALRETLYVAGCYFGEVIRHAAGGRWLDVDEADPSAPIHEHFSPPLLRLERELIDPIGELYALFPFGDSSGELARYVDVLAKLNPRAAPRPR